MPARAGHPPRCRNVRHVGPPLHKATVLSRPSAGLSVSARGLQPRAKPATTPVGCDALRYLAGVAVPPAVVPPPGTEAGPGFGWSDKTRGGRGAWVKSKSAVR